MINHKKIIVSITLGEDEIEVGELIRENRQIYFKYYVSFIDRGIEISPFKLKLSNEIFISPQKPFEGLFGVFADSLPDGWGRLLLDRALTSKGISINQITPLDRLAYVGARGMGALTYKPAVDVDVQEFNIIELDTISTAVQQVLSGTSSEIIEELFNLGGSSGGARPKIQVAYNPTTDNLIHGKNNISTGYEDWLIKFSSSTDPTDIANIEFAYYKMALDCGIEMNESKLFKGLSGKMYFGTKRFDRASGRGIHLHSLAGLLHDDFSLSSLDYGHLMDCAFRLEKNVIAYEKILRLASFNVFAHNRDDHSKNFSFLMDEKGNWKFAPAYDLTFSNPSHGWHSITINGESKAPGKKHLTALAQYFKIKKGSEIIEQVEAVIKNWKYYAKEYGVEKDSLQKMALHLPR
jgi:serine/threonine-protein kinase HipA